MGELSTSSLFPNLQALLREFQKAEGREPTRAEIEKLAAAIGRALEQCKQARQAAAATARDQTS